MIHNKRTRKIHVGVEEEVWWVRRDKGRPQCLRRTKVGNSLAGLEGFLMNAG